MLEVARIVSAVEIALPAAPPFAIAELVKAQIPFLDDRAACALLDELARKLPPDTWDFTEAVLARWSPAAVHHALTHLRALPPGRDRVLALARLPGRLSTAEQREVLDGILDGTLPTTEFRYTKVSGNHDVIHALVRTLPPAWQDEWLATHTDSFDEICREHRAIGRLDEPVVRRLWSEIDHTAVPPDEIPYRYQALLGDLPADLEAQALARIRAADPEAQLDYLQDIRAGLSDAERHALVAAPLAQLAANPHSNVGILKLLAPHLPHVSVELHRQWLHGLLATDNSRTIQTGLTHLLPVLTGDDHRRAEAALADTAIRDGAFFSAARWDLVPDDAFPPLLERLRTDPYGWHRDDIIAHLIAARAPAIVARCLQPVVDGLADLPPDHRVEVVTAMTPWLAERSDRMVPRALAALALPLVTSEPDAHYAIARVLHHPGE